MKTTTAQRKLNAIAKDYNRTDLVRAVAESISDQLDGYENPSDFFTDLASHGCISGMIGELCYYTDTHAFFDTHYNDIMDMVQEYDEQGIEFDMIKDYNPKNTGAWFAYEETARILADELGL